MMYLGDYVEDYADLNVKFHTHSLAGVPTTLAGTPVVSCYKSNNVVQSVAGVTLTVDFDGVTGLNNVNVDLSADAFYVTAEDYQLVITTGTVDGVSVVGAVIASFSIENRFGVTEITDINSDTNTLITGVNVSQISGDSAAADNLEAMLDGTGGVTLTTAITGNITGNLSGSVGSVTGAVGSVTGNVGGNVTGSVGSVAAGGIAAAAFAANAVDNNALAANAATEIATAVLGTQVEAQGAYTLQQAMSICLAVLAGVTSNNGATLETPNGAANRVVATIDGANNRTAMALTPSP